MGDLSSALQAIMPQGDTKMPDDVKTGVQRHYMPVSGGDAAADQYDLALMVCQSDIELVGLEFIPARDLTASDTNNATLDPVKGNDAAGATTRVATPRNTRATAGGTGTFTGSWSKRSKITWTPNTDGTHKLTKDQVLYVLVTKGGTGVALPEGVWVVKYIYQ